MEHKLPTDDGISQTKTVSQLKSHTKLLPNHMRPSPTPRLQAPYNVMKKWVNYIDPNRENATY